MNDAEWLRAAIERSRLCPPSTTAFSVGAVIVVGDAVVASGYSRQFDDHDHAEEVALRAARGRLDHATLYSSLEPCGQRASRPVPCAELIVRAGIPRVVYAWGEPPMFVDDASGADRLREAGVTVLQLTELADEARQANVHLLLGSHHGIDHRGRPA